VTALRDGEGWSEPRPRRSVQPTYTPAAMALGIVLSLWGLLTSWVLLVAGLVLFVESAGGWVGEILRAHRRDEEEDGKGRGEGVA